MPVPVPLDPTPHPPGPLSAALERRVAGAGKCSGGVALPLRTPTPSPLRRQEHSRGLGDTGEHPSDASSISLPQGAPWTELPGSPTVTPP